MYHNIVLRVMNYEYSIWYMIIAILGHNHLQL